MYGVFFLMRHSVVLLNEFITGKLRSRNDQNKANGAYFSIANTKALYGLKIRPTACHTSHTGADLCSTLGIWGTSRHDRKASRGGPLAACGLAVDCSLSRDEGSGVLYCFIFLVSWGTITGLLLPNVQSFQRFLTTAKKFGCWLSGAS